MRNNKRKNGSSLKVGGKYIDETPIRLTEIRLHSLMERTYERAVKDNEKKDNGYKTLWSITFTLLLSWFPMFFNPNKEMYEIIYLIVITVVNIIILFLAIIQTVKKNSRDKKLILYMPENREKAIKEILESENFAEEGK